MSLLLKCSTEGGAGYRKFSTKQKAGLQGWDCALTTLVLLQRLQGRLLKMCQGQKESLVSIL